MHAKNGNRVLTTDPDRKGDDPDESAPGRLSGAAHKDFTVRPPPPSPQGSPLKGPYGVSKRVGGQPIECVSQEGDVLVACTHLILAILDEGERLAQRARRHFYRCVKVRRDDGLNRPATNGFDPHGGRLWRTREDDLDDGHNHGRAALREAFEGEWSLVRPPARRARRSSEG